RSPAGLAARPCWRRWIGPTCSWCRWTKSAAGGGSTICSPTCCATGWRGSGLRGGPSCTAPPPAGTGRPGWPTTPIRHPSATGAAGEVAWAGQLIERHAEEMLWRGEGVTLGRWFQALPAGMLRARPRLRLAQTVTAVFGGQLEAAETLLDGAERAFASVGDEPAPPSVGRASSVLANTAATVALLRPHLAGLRPAAHRPAHSPPPPPSPPPHPHTPLPPSP